MSQQSNLALYLSNKSDKNRILKEIFENRLLINSIDLQALKGVLFSSITIDKLIDEELKHDKVVIKSDENSNLISMSSGQQRKALLENLLAQEPDYIVLDDIYSNIDKETQKLLTLRLLELENSTVLIQIIFRKRDLLNNINSIYIIDNENNISEVLSKVEFENYHTLNNSEKYNFVLPEKYSNKQNEQDILIDLKNIHVNYANKEVLNNINWCIKKGEFWQLVGPNGSGKSTLVSMFTGDNPKAYGQDITIFGRKKGTGESIWDLKSKIGYFTPKMIQSFNRTVTVEEMIISGFLDSIGLYTQPTDIQKDIAKKWTSILGFYDTKIKFQQLSVGQKRMVMVARAMVKHPALLILDEPTIELDDKNSLLFVELIHAIASKKETAIIYISHRDEDNLQPNKIFELVRNELSYTGKIIE